MEISFTSRRSIHETVSNQMRIQLESHTTQQVTSEPSLDIERRELVFFLYNHQINSVSASTGHQEHGPKEYAMFRRFHAPTAVRPLLSWTSFFTCS